MPHQTSAGACLGLGGRPQWHPNSNCCHWIFYALLNDLCAQVAVALHQPLEMISVEMVLRGLYHYSRARLRDESTELIPFYCEHYKLLGLIKSTPKRHRQRDQQWTEIWGSVPGCVP